MNSHKKWISLILAMSVAITMTACGKKAPPKTTEASKPTTTQVSENPADKIMDGAVLTYTKQSFPKTYAQWGADGVARINKLMPKAALLAASSPRCDKVVQVDLSPSRSIPKKEAVFFVNCNNRQQLYFSEHELK
ncbi:MAG: hypothetical protein KIG68_01385 [Oxalobacter sp.]|nr:hypothetical protein [Oxalobacter sp.]